MHRIALLIAAALMAAIPAAPVLGPPVAGQVVEAFHQPTTYGPGHRGVDLAARPGTSVGAPGAGVVAFAGPVAGSQWVTIDHGSVRSTVGPLASVTVLVGDEVQPGDHLGTTARAHGRDALHWSVRQGATYLDPLDLTRPLVASLVPLDAPVTAARGRRAAWPARWVR